MFPSLLNRSHYSFLNSSLSIKDIVEYSLRNNHRYSVITEFNNSHSWVEFYRECKDNNLIPVFGIQINHEFTSLLLISKNLLGYRNLLNISTNRELKDLEGLIVIHLEGEETLKDHKDYFVANREVENGVYIRENKFLNKEDYEFFCVLRAISNNSLVEEEKELNYQYVDDYLNNEVSIGEDSYLVRNIYRVLESCEEYDIFDYEDKLNFFSDPDRRLCELASERLLDKNFLFKKEKSIYRERLKNELRVVIDKKFSAYFLIVHDAVSWSKLNDVFIGPGRGSSCGSLLAYMLKITEIDPIEYDLYFERFLNPERSVLPDIDIDVANNKREALLDYLRSKYGENHVIQISTFQTFKTKNSLREVCRAYGIHKEEIDRLSNSISFSSEIHFDDESRQSNNIRRFFNSNPKIKESIRRIIDFPKALSVHPAGVIISSKPLNLFIPLIKTQPLNISQWEYRDLKDFNLIKFDFLSLQYLSSLSRIEKSVEGRVNKKINWGKVNRNDPRVYKTIIKGRNAFIFQFESHKIHSLIQKFSPKSLLDFALISAIHRPGASAMIAKKASGINSSPLPFPFSKFVSDTYGFLVYQEQLMQIVSEVTGGSLGEADIFRRDLEDSSREKYCREIFFKKGLKRFNKEVLDKCYSYILKFVTYGFNKSHAIAYSEISYRLLWFKTYFPEHFYLELLRFSTLPEHFHEIQEAGFNIEKPCYWYSLYEEFNLVDGSFYFPLSKITSLSLSFEEKFRNIRISREDREFVSAIRKFIEVGVSREDLVILIRTGYFNCLFKEKESEYYWENNLQELIDSFIHSDNPYLKEVIISREIENRYKEYKREYLGINLCRERIQGDLFKKFPSINPISTLLLETNSNKKYIGFVSYLKSYRSFNDIPFLKIKLSDNFYSSPEIVLFDSDKDLLQKALDNRYAVLINIHKTEEFLRGKIIRIFEKDG